MKINNSTARQVITLSSPLAARRKTLSVGIQSRTFVFTLQVPYKPMKAVSEASGTIESEMMLNIEEIKITQCPQNNALKIAMNILSPI